MDGVVAMMPNQRAIAALRVVILRRVKAIIQPNHRAAREFFRQRADEGVLRGMQLAGVFARVFRKII